MLPLVSVIVPIYNCEQYLKRCLDSLQNQDYKNYEVICIDDGSTDKSAQIIKKYPFKYIYQNNQGQAIARNKGIELAIGEWLCFVDADDSVEPNYISEMMKYATEGINMVVCGINRVNEDGALKIDKMKRIGKLNAYNALITVNIGPTNKLIKKSSIKNCRFIGDKLRFEDVLFTPELIINAQCIYVINKPLYNYYVRENSTMRRFDDTLDDIFVVLKRLIDKQFYAEYKDEIDYIVFKNGLFGHFSRIIYLNKKRIKQEMLKAKQFILNYVPNYKTNKYIMNDKQPYFYVGTRLFMLDALWLLILPLRILEKRIGR